MSGFLGAAFLAVAVILHIDHLAYRIGRSAVVLIIASAVVAACRSVPFLIKPDATNQSGWFNFAQALWCTAFVALGLGLASIAIHKEKQIERGLIQVADVGATDPADVTVHASFSSLISASAGAILYAVGVAQQIGSPAVTREAWVFKVLGMILIAVGIISHVEHLSRHIGTGAVTFATMGTVLAAISRLPYAVDPSTTTSSGWGHAAGYGTGAGWLCGAIAVGLVILRKRSIEAESAA